MICKICHQEETNSTSGICWKCLAKWHIQQLALSEDRIDYLRKFIKTKEEKE